MPPVAPLVTAAEAIASPALFGVYASRGQFILAPHVLMIDDALLQACGQECHVIIEAPPRHGKSTMVSGWLPPWFLGTFPTKRVILASYESDFAQTWGKRARDTFLEHGHIFPGRPKPDRRSAARGRWGIDGHPEAGMVSTGIGGSITGRGGDLLIVDDYVKNSEQARSVTYREKTWDWWQATMSTRREPGGSFVIMATRWHEDDLIGRLLKEEGEVTDGGLWTRIRLPAIAEEGDPLGREPGEALWPGRWPLSALERLRRRVGPYWFAALFQATPRVEGGGIFRREWFRYFDPPAHLGHLDAVMLDRPVQASRLRLFQTIDTADSEKTSADFTVVTTWAWSEYGHLILLDRARERMEGPNVLRVAKHAHDRWQPAEVNVEAQTYGRALIRDLRRLGVPVRPVVADTDKVTRALTIAAMYETGQVWHPHPSRAAWVTEWEDELLSFPNGQHDDQVDTASIAGRRVQAWAVPGDGRGLPDDVGSRVEGLGYDLVNRL